MTIADLKLLKQGKTPQTEEVIEHLTLLNPWLENMKDYCLTKLVANGGCKVKILYGDKYTGKTHYLNYVRILSQRSGFFVVMLDIAQMDFQLTNIVSLYKQIAEHLCFDKLKESLLRRIFREIGHEYDQFHNYPGNLYDFICQHESAPVYIAKQLVRKCINSIVKELDISFSFRLFLRNLMEAISENDLLKLEILERWLKGEKLQSPEKRQCQLFERLSKQNSRIWLYSLFEIIKMADYRGLVLIFDHFEAILPQFEARVKYTPGKRNDVYEMLRQLIDDLDFLSSFLFIIAGNKAIIENEAHGLESYHALWMRIQQCFKQEEVVNPYSDLVNADLIMKQLTESGQMIELSHRIEELMSHAKIPMRTEKNYDTSVFTDFRMAILNQTQHYSFEE